MTITTFPRYVFGAPRTVVGTTANDFRYTGQQNDRNANRGLYFLRARSYDPALGRFLQKDPLPLGNRYAYAGNNPGNFADPSGLCGGSWNPRDFADCPGVAAGKVIGAGVNTVRDEANRIGLEKTAIGALTTVSCLFSETGVGFAGCGAGLGGYLFAVIAQQSAICRKVNNGTYSANEGYAKNVLAWAPVPGPFITHFPAGKLLELALERAPHFLPGQECPGVAHASSY